jgi:hypothetical protein
LLLATAAHDKNGKMYVLFLSFSAVMCTKHSSCNLEGNKEGWEGGRKQENIHLRFKVLMAVSMTIIAL